MFTTRFFCGLCTVQVGVFDLPIDVFCRLCSVIILDFFRTIFIMLVRIYYERRSDSKHTCTIIMYCFP